MNSILKNGAITILLTATCSLAWAGKTYNETEFLNTFSGKSKKIVETTLGKPFNKSQSVKPSNANNMVAAMGKQTDNSKPVNVEMWYYKNLVKYDDKHTYKETEITFVNDHVLNIGFFNNR